MTDNEEHPRYEWVHDTKKDICLDCLIGDKVKTNADKDVLLDKLRQVDAGDVTIEEWRTFIKGYMKGRGE